MLIGLPAALRRVATRWPVRGFTTWIVPLPKLPTRSLPANPPNPVGATATPTGSRGRLAGAALEATVVGEHVDEPVAAPGHVVLLGRVLLGVGHVHPVAETGDVERRVAGGDARFWKAEGMRTRAKWLSNTSIRSRPKLAASRKGLPFIDTIVSPL